MALGKELDQRACALHARLPTTIIERRVQTYLHEPPVHHANIDCRIHLTANIRCVPPSLGRADHAHRSVSRHDSFVPPDSDLRRYSGCLR